MKRLLLATLAVALVLGAGNLCSAQDAAPGGAKPLVTISFAGYDRLVEDVKTIGKLAGRPELSAMMDGGLAIATQGKGLAGLDKTRPWGAVVYPGSTPMDFPIMGFVPVTDLKQIMSLVPNPATKKPFAPNAEGVYEIETGKGPTIYVAQKGTWALVVSDRELLKTAPADPAALLGNLAKRYTVAARVSIKNIPTGLRDAALMPIQMGMQMAMQRRPGESDEDYAMRTAGAKMALSTITTAVKELDEVVLGFGTDPSQGATFVDFEVTALPGTNLADRFSALKAAKTDFAGFSIPGAAVTLLSAGTLDDKEVAQYKAMIGNFRTKILKELDNNPDLSKDQQQLAKQLLTDVFDVFDKCIENKKSDSGLALVLTPGAPTLVVGGLIAEGAKLEKALKRLVTEAGKEEPEIAKIVKLDADNHAGVRFHVTTLPVDDAEAAAILGGKTIDIVVGIGDTSLYVGAGKNAIQTLKQVIDKSKAEAGKSIPPMELKIAATPIAQFVSQVAPPPANQMATMAAGILAQAGGKDHLTLTAKAIPNGGSWRLNVEEGLLKAILTMAQAAGDVGGGAVPTKKTVKPSNDPF